MNRRLIRLGALASAAVLAATMTVAARPAAAAEHAGENPQWHSPAIDGAPFSLESTFLDAGVFARDSLSYDGTYVSFLNASGVDGTGKLYKHTLGDDSSTSISGIQAQNGLTVITGANGFALDSIVGPDGSTAHTYVDIFNQNTQVSRDGTYPANISSLNDYVACLSGNEPYYGRYLFYTVGSDRINENDTPEDPSDDSWEGGLLRYMDIYQRYNFLAPVQAKKSWSLVSEGVTSAVCGRDYTAYAYTQVDPAESSDTQFLMYKAPSATPFGEAVQLPLGGDFNVSPYPADIVVRVIDMSDNGKYLVYTVQDESGAINGGSAAYFIYDTETGTTHTTAAAPEGEPDYLPNAIGDNGRYSLVQRAVASDYTPRAPRVSELDGTTYPIGPASVRQAVDPTFGFTVPLDNIAVISGSGEQAIYLTTEPADAADDNEVDDIIKVDINPDAIGGGGGETSPPTASAGGDQTVDEGSTVTIDASASDSNDSGQPIDTYTFDVGNDGSPEQTGSSDSYSFTAGNGPGTTDVAVTVTDADGSDTDTTTINVNNVTPTIDSASVTPTTGTAGATTIGYSASASDPVDTLVYSWDFNGDTVPDAAGTSASHVFVAAGTYNGTLSVSDGNDTTTAALEAVVISDPPTNPPGADAGPDQTVDEGATVTIDASASDSNDSGQPIDTYTFDVGNDGSPEQTGSSDLFSFTAGNGPGTTDVAVTVTDADGSDTDTTTINVNNVAPTGTAQVSPGTGVADVTSFTYSANITDAGNDTLSLAWDFDGDAVTDYTGATPPAQTFAAAGTYTGSVVADDGDGGQVTIALNSIVVNAAGGDPDADDDGDGIINEMDGNPDDATRLGLNRVAGSGTIPGLNEAEATVAVNVRKSTGWLKFTTGSVSIRDGNVRANGSWIFFGAKARSAESVAYVSGTSILGFSLQQGLIKRNYKVAVFDNGDSGDQVVVRVTGSGGIDYANSGIVTGNFDVS